jgi:glycosyltransferase involved in cell wall biosynthesis
MKLLTVILLTYNHEESIARAFDSILEQETNFVFDIFVLEDCSTDRTSDICRQYKAKYPDKIHLFLNERNLGATQNYKQGLLKVKSQYHAFLEGDDYWCDKNKLQLQVNTMEANPDCVICAHRTLLKNLVDNKEELIPDQKKYPTITRYTIKDNIKSVHLSSRVCRNTLDLSSVPDFMFLDTEILSLYLTKGDMLFLDNVMSVYNWTGDGFWTRKSVKQQRLMDLKQRYAANNYLNFSCDFRYFPRSNLLKFLKKSLGIKAGWLTYYNIETARLHLKYLFRK